MSVFPIVFDSYHARPFHRHCHRRHPNLDSLVDVLGAVQAVEPLLQAVEREHNGYYVNNVEFNKEGDMLVHCETEGFKPEELSVDLEGEVLKISGLHKEEKDDEKVERTFNRHIRIPKNVDVQKISCQVDDKGQLTVKVPAVQPVEAKKQNIPIQVKPAEEKKQ
ncbi:unnamed protein product [Bursaphelenchus xylophilus]|uniref:(pine wood nematode) hypothetical protein n=1 Tax=Bursaphelenchus xylophilus TaxID=6326 RepID=A0A1I7RLR9_BURXY|nr:unnamed protein product [Bursaphelenchus xylophilus]CAG9106325.1 unnamed protein product [Bursaphelenchus xylophilus]